MQNEDSLYVWVDTANSKPYILWKYTEHLMFDTMLYGKWV